MNRCAACGTFFDTPECPGDHSHVELYLPPAQPQARLCAACGNYFIEEECPHDHTGILVDKSLITLGNAVTCDVSDRWPDAGPIPGILVGLDGDQYRVILGLPGEHGSVATITLPADKLS